MEGCFAAAVRAILMCGFVEVFVCTCTISPTAFQNISHCPPTLWWRGASNLSILFLFYPSIWFPSFPRLCLQNKAYVFQNAGNPTWKWGRMSCCWTSLCSEEMKVKQQTQWNLYLCRVLMIRFNKESKQKMICLRLIEIESTINPTTTFLLSFI